jgi:hypothetical protein
MSSVLHDLIGKKFQIIGNAHVDRKLELFVLETQYRSVTNGNSST